MAVSKSYVEGTDLPIVLNHGELHTHEWNKKFYVLVFSLISNDVKTFCFAFCQKNLRCGRWSVASRYSLRIESMHGLMSRHQRSPTTDEYLRKGA